LGNSGFNHSITEYAYQCLLFSMPILKVTTLSKRFGSRLVLDRLSFIADREIIGISGKNGSGKTTLMRCLAGLMQPGKGTIEWNFDGVVADRSKIRMHSGLAGPWIQLYREMSCFENLEFLGRLHQLPSLPERVDACLERVGMIHLRAQAYGSLSSGQQQRMKLASAIIHDPIALLLDEPGSNLDDAGAKIVYDLIDYWRKQERILILASNDPDELALCDRIISVSDKIITQPSTTDLTI
jgi:ABC-type multidrug transport system ATPase subunit